MGECGIPIVNHGIWWGSVVYLLLTMVSGGECGIPIVNPVSAGGVLHTYF